MKKLVLKTTAITLASVLAVCLLVIGGLALFSPVTLAGFFDGVGSYSASVYFYERQYAKSGTFYDLSVLVLKIDDDNDSVRAEKYLQEFVTHENYIAYCALADGQEQTVTLTSNEYYSSRYAVSLVRNGKYTQAETFCSIFVKDNDYSAYNPFRTLLTKVGSLLSEDELESMELQLGIILATADSSETELINSDLDRISELKS